MVILVAAIIGSIFLEMYQDTTRRQYRTQLSNQAERVKARFQEFIRNEDYQGCLSYLEILQEIEQVEIWSLANPYSDTPMNQAMTTIDFFDVKQEDYTNLIYSAFLGKERFLTSYSEIHGCTIMSVSYTHLTLPTKLEV